jgi:hypothetical protein
VTPDDGTLYAATHHGVFRVPAGSGRPRSAGARDASALAVDEDGSQLSGGHPDLHGLQVAHGRVYAFDAAQNRLMVSTDRRSWQRRASAALQDFAVSPQRPDLLIAIAEDAVLRSDNGGWDFRAVAAPPLVLLAWPSTPLLIGAMADGTIAVTRDGGASWE